LFVNSYLNFTIEIAKFRPSFKPNWIRPETGKISEENLDVSFVAIVWGRFETFSPPTLGLKPRGKLCKKGNLNSASHSRFVTFLRLKTYSQGL